MLSQRNECDPAEDDGYRGEFGGWKNAGSIAALWVWQQGWRQSGRRFKVVLMLISPSRCQGRARQVDIFSSLTSSIDGDTATEIVNRCFLCREVRKHRRGRFVLRTSVPGQRRIVDPLRIGTEI